MDDEVIDARTLRCNKSAPTAAQKDTLLGKSRLSREDFCRLNNCTDEDYMLVETIARECLKTVVDIQIDEPIEGVANPGDPIKLYMLLGKSAKLKTLWKKAVVPFEAKMRKRFPGFFSHVGATADFTVKSHHDGDRETDIVVLTDGERDKLLHRVWTREGENVKDMAKGSSPTKKRRRIAKADTTVEKPIKTARLPSTPRLWNSVLWVWEVTPAEFTNEEERTTLARIYQFSKFCDHDDYTAVSSGQKVDLDTALFSCRKLCEIIKEESAFDLEKGSLSLTKARRRCDRAGDSKHKWSFQRHTEHKAEYYLEKMLEQWVAEAALDPDYTFELSFRKDEDWAGVDMPKW